MRTLWNDGWRFVKLPPDSAYADLRTAEPRPVLLPHDWLIADADDLYQDGDGWYVNTLTARPDWADKRVFLCFDGVYAARRKIATRRK